MASFNRVVLVGRLTREVDFKAINADSAVGNFSLAVNERRKDKSGTWVDDANFFDCVAWNKSAEILRDYTQKGSSILVEGRLQQDTWEQDGQKRSRVRIIAEKIVLLDKKDDSNGGQSNSTTQPSQARQTAQRGKKQTQQQSYDSYDSGTGGDDIPF